jgi:hypothetical protein
MPPNWIGPKPKGVKTRRVIIAGTRTFDNYKLLKEKVEQFTFWFEDIEVVSGAQKKRVERNGEWIYVGADYLGEQWAQKNWWIIHRFWPDWETHGKAAGPIRNREMVKFANCAVIFWDGYSPGTANLIDNCRIFDLPHRVVRY